MILPYDQRLKPNSRSLRSKMTDAEQVLWQRLRRKQINDWQFYRQKPLGPYIVDFYCAAARLVIELDGSQHFEPPHRQADQQRDAYLQSLGLRVLRFDNRQVLLETEGVLEIIRQIPKSPPAPPFSKGGDEGGSNSSRPSVEKSENPVRALEEGRSETVSVDKIQNSVPAFNKDQNPIPPFEKDQNPVPPFTKDQNPVPPFEKGGLGGINQNPAPANENKP